MAYRSIFAKKPGQFTKRNVLGLRGYVFGKHWGQKRRIEVPTKHGIGQMM